VPARNSANQSFGALGRVSHLRACILGVAVLDASNLGTVSDKKLIGASER